MTEFKNWTFNKVSNFECTQVFPVREYSNIGNIDEQGLFCAKFRGSLFTLFGQPTVDNKDLDDGVYEYSIKCANKSTGDTAYFIITELRLGPVLSASDNSIHSKELGLMLWDKILMTSPSDFNAKYFDDENTLKVYYGCKNASPYFDLKPFNPIDYVSRFSRMLILR